MSDHETGRVTLPPKMSKDEVIVSMVIENKSLLKASFVLVKENDEQARRIKELETQLEDSLSKEYISSLVKRLVRTGKVPTPKGVLKYDLPITCICEPGDVDFRFGSVYARVAFECSGYTETVGFDFVPVPRTNDYYPDFHMSYEKQKPVAPKKPHTRKKKSDTSPPAAS